MQEKPIQILLVEDDKTAARLLQDILMEITTTPFELHHAGRLSEALTAITNQRFDLILLDLGLPESRGMETFARVHAHAPGLPIIVLTGSDDETMALQIVRTGAQDYLVKGSVDPHLLNRSIRYAIERNWIEEALRKSEAKNRALLHAIPDLMLRIRSDGTYLDYKRAKNGYPSVPHDHFLGKKVHDILPPELAESTMLHVKAALRSGEIQFFEYQSFTDGQERDYEARIVATSEDEALEIIRDITEHKNLEKHMLQIIGAEQRRIGQDLHDGLGQHLTGIAFMSQVLGQKLMARSAPEAADATKIVELVNQGIGQTRDLARGLFPVELEANGLTSALQELTSNAEGLFKLKCELTADPTILIYDNTLATHLYRIVQESINNAVKHGKARSVRINLSRSQTKLCLRVEDDGSGFPTGSTHGKGMGLCIMKYRARMVGGTIDFQQKEGSGVIVTCHFQNTNEHNKDNRDHYVNGEASRS